MNVRFVQIARSVAVIGGTGALIAGATLAAVGDLSTVTLSGNTLSATAGLQIAPDASGSAGTFATSATGFSATTSGMRFGSERKAGDFWLKNVATGDQSVTVNVPTNPTLTGLNPAEVHIRITKGAVNEAVGTLADLETPAGLTFTNNESPSAGGTKYSVYYTIDKPSGGGVSASVSSFDLSFTGTEL